jgi:hypothetical protein
MSETEPLFSIVSKGTSMLEANSIHIYIKQVHLFSVKQNNRRSRRWLVFKPHTVFGGVQPASTLTDDSHQSKPGQEMDMVTGSETDSLGLKGGLQV